jgi:arylsulfatase A-like enzyme
MPVNRRQFLLGTLAAPALAATKKQPAKQPATVERPNIVLIVADDLGAYMLGCYGNKEIRVPNIDRLALVGVRFSNAFSSSPVALERSLPEGLIGDVLASAGYNRGSATSAGQASEFLEAQAPAKPFSLTLTWSRPAAAAIPQKYLDLYAGTSFEATGWESAAPNATQKEMMRSPQSNLRKYAAGLSMLDEQVPVLLSKLQQRGLGDNTLIVLTGNNGYLAGHHGLWGDGLASDPINMYEEVVHVPLIWSWPSRFPPQTMRTEVVGSNDLLPSLCELTGAAPPPGRDLTGQSYLPFAYGRRLPKKQSWRGVTFARFRNTEMARDDRYKLILRDQGKGPNELYDESVDVTEKTNQYDNAQYVTVRDRFASALAAWRTK